MSGGRAGRGAARGEAGDASSGPGSAPGDVVVVLVTGPDAATLAELGRTVVEERLAACANVLPGVRSVFRWEGAVQEEDEALAILKTSAGRVEALRRRVRETHPYDEPEFLVLAVDGGSESYLRWVAASVTEG